MGTLMIYVLKLPCSVPLSSLKANHLYIGNVFCDSALLNRFHVHAGHDSVQEVKQYDKSNYIICITLLSGRNVHERDSKKTIEASPLQPSHLSFSFVPGCMKWRYFGK